MNKKNLFKLVLVGLGNNASKTLKKLNKDTKIQVVYCIPRISLSNNGWFDKGILADTSKKLGINIIKKKNLNDPNFVKLIASSNIDLIINIGHAQLFNLDLINSSTFGILNYHPGLLPGARGSGAVVGELMNGQNLFGRTCHLVNEKFDLGSVINQEKFRISNNATMSQVFGILEKNVDEFIFKSAKKVLSQYKIKSSQKIKKFGRYYPKFEPGDEYIDWNDATKNIYDRIRSRLQERYAITYIKKDLKKILIAKAEIPKKFENYKSVNGQVIDVSKKGILLKTQDSAIWIRQIFDQKKKMLVIPNFKIGTCFQTINIADFIKNIINLKKK